MDIAWCSGRVRLGVRAKTRIKFRRVFTNNCVSFISFMKALKYIPISISYAVFVGFGTIFIVIAEIISDYAANGALPNFIRLFFIATLILGVLGLKRVKQ